MRLIDADTLKENIPKTNGKIFSTVLIDCDEVRKMIDEQPTIDPVKHGKWLKLGDCGTVQCSECFDDFDYIDGLCYLCHGQELPNYCPNCGAKMDGEEQKG